jgi:protease IV
VVLRVDSPGGDGSASDLIWHEVVRLRERKPVVVSMSSLSASGGYYISCPANYIMADPGTITDSIGVFAMFFDLSGLYEKLGISHETVKRGKYADLSSTFRGRTPEEMEMLKKVVQDFYQGFIERVANGRKLTKEQVDQIGQGRVWTGRQAKENGLVDELGGLSKAINKAKELVGMKPDSLVKLVHLPKPKFSLHGLMREIGLATEESLPLPAVIQDSLRQLAMLASLNADPVLVLLPFQVRIK